MTMFGLSENEVVPLVTALAGRDVPRDDQLEIFARAAWTGIAEPGDRLAGLVVQQLGAVEALRTLLTQPTVASLFARLQRGGAVDLEERQVDDALKRWRPRQDPTDALYSMRQAARVNARLLVPADSLWPTGVDDLGDHAPIALWVRGTDAALAALPRSIALVGARAATGYGEHVTMEASAGLVDRGYAIVSGAAYGIDGMAHRAALASHGQTIAFLAGGVDRFYPSGHDALLTRIADEGAVISELPCGQAPTKWRFLQRNRLIAAASMATVVLEAGWRSGSLNTAGHASTLGRALGAVPGPVTSAASAGCHRLIRDYTAICVTNPDEMAELAPLDRTPMLFEAGDGVESPVEGGIDGGDRLEGGFPGGLAGGLSDGLTPATHKPPGVVLRVGSALDSRSPEITRLFDAMSVRSPRQVSDIAARAGLSLDAVRALLGALALEGEVAERERGWVRVVRKADRD